MKLFIIIYCSLLLVACGGRNAASVNPSKPIQCHLAGEVIDRPESEVLELYTHIDGEAAVSSRPIAEIEIQDGHFSYDLSLDEADYCTLSFAEEKRRGAWFPIRFIADGDTVRLTLYPEGRESEHRIEGSGATAEFQAYKAQLGALSDQFNRQCDSLEACSQYYTARYAALMEQFETAERGSKEFDALVKEVQGFSREEALSPVTRELRAHYEAERKAVLLDILDAEPSIARYALLAEQMQYRLPESEVLDLYYRRYADALSEHYLAAYCRRQLSGLQLQVGSAYIDFEAPDPEGTMHRFSELIAGSKITMLDLWASWCGPCRRASKEMIPLYEQYRDRGFTVVGVAREAENLKALNRAIEQDNYPWPQLVELDNRIHLWSQYGCGNAAGRRLLINAEGVILAIDPTIEELTAAVKQACQ